MALSKADCEKVIHTALDYNKTVFCVMQNRYSPPSVWLKEITENKVLGDIYMVQLNCYWNRDERYYKPGGWKGTQALDGGTLFTQFSHWIDIMYWLFGDIKNIQAKFADFNHQHSTAFEDSGFVSFDFERRHGQHQLLDCSVGQEPGVVAHHCGQQGQRKGGRTVYGPDRGVQYQGLQHAGAG
jgi:predicted dehydrogenase